MHPLARVIDRAQPLAKILAIAEGNEVIFPDLTRVKDVGQRRKPRTGYEQDQPPPLAFRASGWAHLGAGLKLDFDFHERRFYRAMASTGSLMALTP